MVKPCRSGDETEDGEYSQPCIPSFYIQYIEPGDSSEEEGFPPYATFRIGGVVT